MADEIEDAERPADEAGAATRASYSSVVYFHGMGSQRRYEETSRLVDCLDKYLVRQHRGGNSLGMLRNIRVRVEPLRGDPQPKGIIGYIRTIFSGGPQAEAEPPRSVRFYEVYWAPVMADSKSAWGVAKWLFKQPLRPWRTVACESRRASLTASSTRRATSSINRRNRRRNASCPTGRQPF